jgi:hypothetical protein
VPYLGHCLQSVGDPDGHQDPAGGKRRFKSSRPDQSHIFARHDMVELDAVTGEVFAFGDQRRPYTTPGASRFTQAQAQSAAVGFAGHGHASKSELCMTWDKQGRQLLVWEVLVEGNPGEPGRVVEVDAGTGAGRDPDKY